MEASTFHILTITILQNPFQVEIAINNVEVDLQMKLGVAGEAFFVERASMKESIPLNLATSPLPSSSNLLDFQFSHVSGDSV